MRHSDAFAKGKLIDALAKGGDFADNLMAKDHAWFYTVGGQLEEIGAAKSDASELQEQFAGPRYRNGARLHRGVFAAKAGDDIITGRHIGFGFRNHGIYLENVEGFARPLFASLDRNKGTFITANVKTLLLY